MRFPKRRRVCRTGKVEFASRRAAVYAAERRAEQYGVPAKPYRCPHCRYWHLTTKMRGGGKK